LEGVLPLVETEMVAEIEENTGPFGKETVVGSTLTVKVGLTAASTGAPL
jgi:hypothetical protein